MSWISYALHGFKLYKKQTKLKTQQTKPDPTNQATNPNQKKPLTSHHYNYADFLESSF